MIDDLMDGDDEMAMPPEPAGGDLSSQVIQRYKQLAPEEQELMRELAVSPAAAVLAKLLPDLAGLLKMMRAPGKGMGAGAPPGAPGGMAPSGPPPGGAAPDPRRAALAQAIASQGGPY